MANECGVIADEGGMIIYIILNPGVCLESYAHLVSHFKLYSHAIGCCLATISSYMDPYSDHWLPILHEEQYHSSGNIKILWPE